MRVGSLFAGIAGFDLAFERAGFEIAWSVERDAACRRVLERRFPGVPVYDDVRAVHATTECIEWWPCDGCLPAVDVLVGGFPCQDLSVAGRRAGLAGERSGLWWEFHRLISELAPSWVIAENVPGLLSSNGGQDFGAVLGSLAELGYGWAYRVMDAQFWGVAQRRRRVFIVGRLGDGSGPAQVLLEPEGRFGDPPTRRTARTGVAGRAASGANGPGGHADVISVTLASDPISAHDLAMPCTGRNGDPITVAHPLTTQHSADRGESSNLVTHALTAKGHDASEDGTGRGTPLAVVNALTAHEGGPDDNTAAGGGSRDIAATLNSGGNSGGFRTEPGEHLVMSEPKAFAENQRGEAVESDYTHQLTTGGGKPGQGYPAVREGMAVRRLMPIEMCRLQGFPDDWLDDLELSDSVKARMLGNAVAVPVVNWIARRLREVEESR